MNKQFRRASALMLARAQELGLVSKSGAAPAVDLMEELLAASFGYRNAHAYRAALAKREEPALVQENPEQSGSDYKLVNGKGCWVTLGAFSVHPYLTDEGIVVDVYPVGAEDESIASTWAMNTDAEEGFLNWHGLDIDVVAEWVQPQGCNNFDELSSAERISWMKRFYGESKPVAPREAS